MSTLGAAGIGDDAATMARCGGREWLSLALLESRNELLARLGAGPAAAPAPEALRLAASAGWFQEWWVARHLQRARGEAAVAASPRLASIEPAAEAWLLGAGVSDAEDIRHYLGQTLELTLDLLAHAEQDGAGLYVFRLALQHDDRIAEQLGWALPPLRPAPRPAREAIGVPAGRWQLGSERAPAGLFVPHGERWAHEVTVPEFEIDAQCVNWAQFAEFAEDGGYDRRECWSEVAWAWLQQDGRRAPQSVEQLAGSVLVSCGTEVLRAPSQQAAMQLTRHEAEAWCRWAGRRLPTEPEWELAAHTAVRRGFAWGDVLEWVAGSARLFPGAEAAPPPGTLDVIEAASGLTPGVLRGCSSATPARWRHPKARRFALPHEDRLRTGFRSCAI